MGGQGGSANAAGGYAAATGGSANAAGGLAINGPITNTNTAAGGAGGEGGSALALGGSAYGGSASTGPVTSENTNTNSLSNTNTNTSSNSNSNNAASNQSQATNNSNNSTVVVEGDRFAANTASAPSLVVGSDTCMGSTSAGGQGMAFGFSFGTSWTDKNCVRLKNSRQLQAMGYGAAAAQLMCQDKDVRRAMEEAGTSCSALRRKDD